MKNLDIYLEGLQASYRNIQLINQLRVNPKKSKDLIIDELKEIEKRVIFQLNKIKLGE